MRTLTITIILFSLACGLVACGGEANEVKGTGVVGTWTVDASKLGPALKAHIATLPEAEQTDATAMLPMTQKSLAGMVITLVGDGTYTQVIHNPMSGAAPLSGTWAKTDGGWALTPTDGPAAVSVRREGEQMVGTLDGLTLYFDRK